MSEPIDFYYWPTPNGWKVAIALEEMGLPYSLHLVNIGKGDQLKPEFLKLSPNNRMPAILDPDGPDGAPISVFESGAILQYLARKTGRFYGTTERDRIEIDQWLFWQMAGVGPMAGQAHHFLKYAPTMDPPNDLPYAKDRYRREVTRLYRILDQQLFGRDYVTDAGYSIADMALWPWVRGWEGQQQSLEDKPNLARWLDRVGSRPATAKGQQLKIELRGQNAPTDREAQKILFGQGR
ncbi:MAG: glutathione S-transferase N-terminal domain-containing protein [Pseudomonadota bacterium]